MSGRVVQEALLLAHNDNLIDDDEFIMLYDINKSRNPDFPYWNYDVFDLDKLSDDECNANFRFLKNDIYNLVEVLEIPNVVRCSNRQIIDPVEALCILLRRLAYPCRFGDIVPIFGRSVPELSNITSVMMTHMHNNYGHKLTNMNQPWLAPPRLQEFADVIHARGAPLDNCWAFVDGTVRPCSRPGQHQRALWNGHKRVHSLKFQSLVTPNGLIAQLHGPFEGKRHDSAILGQSGLYDQLIENSLSPDGNILCIYGDPAYPLRPHLQRPFQGARLNDLQRQFNTAMSEVRVAVEWVFGDILNYFKFIDFKKNFKVCLSPVGKMYLVCGLLQNAHTILYNSTTSRYFNVDSPSLEYYFQ